MKITYDEATDIIYSELRNCENSIAKKLGLKEVDVDIIGDNGVNLSEVVKKERIIIETYWEYV